MVEKLDAVKSFVTVLFQAANNAGYKIQVVGENVMATPEEVYSDLESSDGFASADGFNYVEMIPDEGKPVRIGKLEYQLGIFSKAKIIYDGRKVNSPTSEEVLRYGVVVDDVFGIPQRIGIIEGTPKFGNKPVSIGHGTYGTDLVMFSDKTLEEQLAGVSTLAQIL